MCSWLCLGDGLIVLAEVVDASVGDAHLPVRVVEERLDGPHLEVWVLAWVMCSVDLVADAECVRGCSLVSVSLVALSRVRVTRRRRENEDAVERERR